jgi:hypothetical protein
MAPDISCVPSLFRCGVWTFFYLFQTGLGGLLAVVAGLLIYAAGRSQANAANNAAADTIAHEKEMRRLDREDILSRNQSLTMHLVTELRFDAEALRFVVEVIHLQLRTVIQLRRRGRLANIPSFKVRLEKLASALIRADDRLAVLPRQLSAPAGHLIAWLDDLAIRCRNIDMIFNQKDGSLNFELWDAEFAFVLAGFDDFDEAALAFVSFQTSPAAAFRRYAERYQAVQRDAILKQKAPGGPRVPVPVNDGNMVSVAVPDLEDVPPYRNPFRRLRRTLEPPNKV